MAPTPAVRLPWIDHLRTFVIILVVNLHSCVTYSHVGDWYFKSPPEPTLEQKIPFIIWEGHLQSFFMGLLFFISGYFAHGALERRGPGKFIRERLFRLGLPALFYMLIIHPFILLGLNPWNYPFGSPTAFYLKYITSGRFLGSSGPLWFGVALLLFCVVLALIRWLRSRALTVESSAAAAVQSPTSSEGPSARFLWLFGLGLGLGSFAVRLVQPIGTNVLNLQLSFFAQYVAFFAAGLHAARHGWLVSLATSRRARNAGWLALVGGPLVQVAVMVLGTKGGGSIESFFGGWRWQALGFALWEQLAGVGLSLGALALFASRANVDSSRLRWLADRSFGVYVLHAAVLVGLAMLFRALPQHLYGSVALLTVAGLAVSYLLADVVKRVPGLRAIF